MFKRLLGILLFVMLLIPDSAVEAVEKHPPYFGVGAEIDPLPNNSFQVETKGVNANEGFVFTVQASKDSNLMHFQVELRGQPNDQVYLKVEETDPRGKFIQEHTSKPFSLSKDWQTYPLPITINEQTAQLDLFVLSTEKKPITFHFKNALVK
ncbi:hypothetical protein [Salirhabdus sp. Marseille-P4669]|uniref:hypothetical protein n=1 Tax=Salirhabdus sp. Marseille-P4669 TaxID=2042310 RepID=UPI000C7BB70D|nr:hypothetical protein [Salirhabdus sp. Marseille-P4669]